MADEKYPERAYATWELAESLNVMPITIRRWIKGGKLRGFRLPDGQYRVLETALKAFLERGKVRLPAKRRIHESRQQG